MKTYPMNEARAEFSKLVDKALAGEPQRVTRYGKEAVVIVSEQDWQARSRSAPTLGHLLAQFAETDPSGEKVTDRPWKERPLGIDFE
jgi:prevent-host-death family protein